MDKKQYVLDIIEKVTTHKPYTREEINTALKYLHEFTQNDIFFDSKIKSMQIGGLLAKALSNI